MIAAGVIQRSFDDRCLSRKAEALRSFMHNALRLKEDHLSSEIVRVARDWEKAEGFGCDLDKTRLSCKSHCHQKELGSWAKVDPTVWY